MEKISVKFGQEELTIETGRMARQADGSVLVTIGETVVLVTVCASKSPREGADFFPLVCDYIEKTYAAGKIPGGYLKREGRLSNAETLTSRLMDRPIRPLFPETFKCDTQVMATVLSADKVNDPAINAIVGAGAALSISEIPFDGPVVGVRVGRIDSKLVANPTFEQQEESDLDLLVVVGPNGIVMVEGEAHFLPEQIIVDALDFAQEVTQPVMDAVSGLQKKVGKAKRPVDEKIVDADLKSAVTELAGDKLSAAILTEEKLPRYAAIDALWAEIKAGLAEKYGDEFSRKSGEAKGYFGELKSEFMRGLILKKNRRIDGRGLTDIRPLTLETGVLPRTHGSALFTRGETQALVTCTLGTSHDEQRVDSLTGDWRKSFLLHYNFPAFSVGEVKMLRGPGRREIGHGTLAERGVEKILPVSENFPYTIRIVSEILESNGSSSMASVCGASMALMNAGVPVSSSVAGIAMGLIQEGDDTAILTDILGDEDHMGDMDFKVVGNHEGISAVQMDIKINGMKRQLMEDALEQARVARLDILGQMDECIGQSNENLSQHAPRIFTILINPDRILDLIGPGGKHIKGIVEQTGVTVDVDDAGKVSVAAIDQVAAGEAIQLIKSYTEEPEVGRVYLGQVVKVVDFGAFVRILPGSEGLLHISELCDERVERVTDIVEEGDEVLVKVLNIDKSGKIRLSRKAALAESQGAGATEEEDAA
jgi:polyribonucleotide nucleotidyltransferase